MISQEFLNNSSIFSVEVVVSCENGRFSVHLNTQDARFPSIYMPDDELNTYVDAIARGDVFADIADFFLKNCCRSSRYMLLENGDLREISVEENRKYFIQEYRISNAQFWRHAVIIP